MAMVMDTITRTATVTVTVTVTRRCAEPDCRQAEFSARREKV
jgi:hypothetical protein